MTGGSTKDKLMGKVEGLMGKKGNHPGGDSGNYGGDGGSGSGGYGGRGDGGNY